LPILHAIPEQALISGRGPVPRPALRMWWLTRARCRTSRCRNIQRSPFRGGQTGNGARCYASRQPPQGSPCFIIALEPPLLLPERRWVGLHPAVVPAHAQLLVQEFMVHDRVEHELRTSARSSVELIMTVSRVGS